MGNCVEGGPRVVTNGLMLCLDAANLRSYPMSGTAWSDLSGNKNDGVLAQAIYDSNNGGSLGFAGNICTISSSLSSLFSTTENRITYSFWIKPNINQANNTIRVIFNVFSTGYGGGRIFVIGRSNFGQYYTGVGFYVTNVNSADSSVNIDDPQGKWMNVVFLWDTAKHRIFINGIESASYSTQTSLSASASTSSSPITLAGDTLSANPTFYGNIGNFMIYNRSLSEQEIAQNYSALKSRFGL